MQGIGNDYVYIDATTHIPENLPELARKISDRHFGVGSDGLVLIMRSDIADLRMRMFNADGSEAEMCGNASRCVGKFAHDRGLVEKDAFTLETGAGIKTIQLHFRDGEVWGATVDMGEPILAPADIPVAATGPVPLVGHAIEVDGQDFAITAVSMGNPHAVLFVEDPASLELPALGPKFEHHSFFPARVNTEFVKVVDRHHIRMRVWERGAGETLACGTGACAVLVACVLNGLTDREADIELRGGTLRIKWSADNHVYMTGPAVTVFEGQYCLQN